jgi:glycosyltransferase involved in cell wall biosynthesis
MNIAIFTNNYLPNPYGVATSIETFRREFEKRGHRVYIFAPKWKGYQDKNPQVFRYPSLDIEIKFKFPLAIPYSWKIGKILKSLNIDIIHSQHPNLLGTAAMKWAKKLARRQGGKKIPLIFTWHTLYDQYAHFAKIIPSKIAARYMINKAVRYADRADAVIVPTDSIIPILRCWGVRNKKIIPVATGVEGRDFADSDRNAMRNKYKIAANEILLFSSHRLTEEKNMIFLFQAVLPLLKNKQVKFLVAGDGYLASELKNFCKKNNVADRVFFCGIVQRAEIKNYYAAADIFVHASKSETQGMVISEAMYAGLPIVAVSATGAKSLVLNGGNGFLVSEKEEEFSEAVLKLVNNKDLRNKFSEVSKKIARTQFTAKICAEKMLTVYREAIERK